MRNFGDVVKEIRATLNTLLFFETFLNSSIVFLLFYFFFAFIDVKALYAVVPAGLFFAVFLFFKLRENKILAVESAYPELREKLRTAADNLDLHNMVVDELHSELVKEIKQVESSNFFNERKIYLKVMAVILLSFSLLFLAPVHFDAPKMIVKMVDITEKNFPINFAAGGNERFYESNLTSGIQTGAVVSGNLYGQRSVAVLGSEEMLLQFKSASQDLNVRKEGDVSKKEFTEEYPNEVYVASAGSFEENIPRERQELVKNYFKNLAES